MQNKFTSFIWRVVGILPSYVPTLQVGAFLFSQQLIEFYKWISLLPIEVNLQSLVLFHTMADEPLHRLIGVVESDA